MKKTTSHFNVYEEQALQNFIVAKALSIAVGVEFTDNEWELIKAFYVCGYMDGAEGFKTSASVISEN